MALYTEFDAADISVAMRKYGVADFRVEHLSGGMANTSYLISAKSGTYVLTILDNHDAGSADALARLMERLVANGIPTQSVIRSLSDEYVVFFKDRLLMLKTYMDGSCLDPLPEKYLALIGGYLAKVHEVPAPGWMPIQGRRLPPDHQTRMANFADQEFANWLMENIKLTMPLAEFEGPSGLIHGDIFADNIIVDRMNNVAIIDWETACNDLLVLDVAMTLVGLCRVDGKFLAGRACEFLKGYDECRPMSTNEKDVLQLAVIYDSVVIAYHRYLRHHVTYPDVAKQHLYLEMPKFVNSVQERWTDLIAALKAPRVEK